MNDCNAQSLHSCSLNLLHSCNGTKFSLSIYLLLVPVLRAYYALSLLFVLLVTQNFILFRNSERALDMEQFLRVISEGDLVGPSRCHKLPHPRLPRSSLLLGTPIILWKRYLRQGRNGSDYGGSAGYYFLGTTFGLACSLLGPLVGLLFQLGLETGSWHFLLVWICAVSGLVGGILVGVSMRIAFHLVMLSLRGE